MARDDEIKVTCEWFESILADHKRKITELMIRTENVEAGLQMLRKGRLLDAMKRGADLKIQTGESEGERP